MVLTRNSTLAIRNSRDVAAVFQDLLSLEDTIDRDKEHYYVMHVNVRRQIKLVELVAIGTLNHAAVHPEKRSGGQLWRAQTVLLLPTIIPQAISHPRTRISS
jgi:hypothetical protein